MNEYITNYVEKDDYSFNAKDINADEVNDVIDSYQIFINS